MAHPPPVEHRRLVDDVVAPMHRGNRLCCAFLVRSRPITVEPCDPPTLAFQLLDVAHLVPPAAITDQIERRIREVRLFERAVGHGQIQSRQMAALEEPDQVGRRNDQLPIAPLHRPTLAKASVKPVVSAR